MFVSSGGVLTCITAVGPSGSSGVAGTATEYSVFGPIPFGGVLREIRLTANPDSGNHDFEFGAVASEHRLEGNEASFLSGRPLLGSSLLGATQIRCIRNQASSASQWRLNIPLWVPAGTSGLYVGCVFRNASASGVFTYSLAVDVVPLVQASRVLGSSG